MLVQVHLSTVQNISNLTNILLIKNPKYENLLVIGVDKDSKFQKMSVVGERFQNATRVTVPIKHIFF